MAPTFPALRGEYARLWGSVQVKRAADADAVARRILRDRARYEAVEAATGVPWEFVAVLHDRESGGSFAGVLHNGERIIGTGRKTRLVPKGRGPFASWQAAAVDALKIKGLEKIRDWSAERCLFEGERFNGFSYRSKGKPSPYVWSGTSHYQRGKYVRDGVYDAKVVDKQLGIAAVMARLMALDPSITFTRAAGAVPVYGPGTWNSAGLRSVQTMLRDRGYASVGIPDGDWGPNTENALEDFQRVMGLPATGRYDPATAAALPTAPARPVSAVREAVTSRDLRQAGAGAVIGAWRAKIGAGAVMAGSTALGLAEGVLGKLAAAGDVLGTVRDLLADVPPWAWALIVFAVAAVIYLQSRNAERAAVAAVRRGDDAGPVGLGDLRTAPEPVEPDFAGLEAEEEEPAAVAAPLPMRKRAAPRAHKPKPAKAAA